MQNRVNEEEPHLMVVIVLLILSASAIAMPPLGPSWLNSRLRNEGVTKKERSECCYRRGNKKCELQSGGNTCKTESTTRRGASLDVRDRRVDLERLCDRDATLGAEIVAKQAAKRGGNKIRMIGMLLPSR
jgi:hypothetical protein